MPVPNDLTPEEEAAFATHGVTPAGPGVEPNGEASPAQAAPAAPDTTQPRAPNGQFASEQPTPIPATTESVVPPGATSQELNPSPPPPGFVPHAALHAERTARQQAMQQMQLLQTRMNAMLAGQPGTPQGQPADMPSLAEDPVGYIQALESRLNQFEQARQEETQFRQIDSQIEQDEAQFAAYTPDYEQASAHYVQSRAQELLQFYPPQQAQKIMMDEARQIAQQAWQRGIPAAQAVYQLAQARGYRPGMPPTPAVPFAGTPQGVPTAPPTPQAAQMAPSAVVAAAQAGQQASRSLSGASGGASPATLNAEAVLGMSDEEFEAYLNLGQKGANQRFAAIGLG